MKQLNTKECRKIFDEVLDECYPVIEMCGCKYNPSYVLFNIDEVTYNESTRNYLDSQDIQEADDDYCA